MLSFAIRSMATRRFKIVMTALSVVLAASVALLAYNISTQVSEGIVNTAAKYDIIIGPSGSATQLAMNTLFFTDKPLGTIPYEIVEKLRASGRVNAVVPFSMGDSFNGAPIVGTDATFLEDKALKEGAMFAGPMEAVVGYDAARSYVLHVGDKIVSSHGLASGGAAHEGHPLTVTGILARTDTAYDNAVFTPVSTVWELHEHGEEEEEHEHEEDHDHAEAGEICAVLVRSKSMNDYAALMSAYGEDAGLLAINPNTVLREVMENVDLSRKIVYILCAVILVMNLFVVTLIALLNLADSRKEIALMRLIGIGMGKINRLYLIQNALTGLAAAALSLLTSRLCLWGVRGFAARMGIVLSAWRVYPMEFAILAAVFAVSILPTCALALRMSREDGMA